MIIHEGSISCIILIINRLNRNNCNSPVSLTKFFKNFSSISLYLIQSKDEENIAEVKRGREIEPYSLENWKIIASFSILLYCLKDGIRILFERNSQPNNLCNTPVPTNAYHCVRTKVENGEKGEGRITFTENFNLI